MAQWTLFNADMAKDPFMRWGTNAMVGIDQYSATLNATASSRSVLIGKLWEWCTIVMH